MHETNFLFIGGGNMAAAIINGSGVAEHVCVVDPNAEKRAEYPNTRVTIAEGMAWLAEQESSAGAGQVLLAVKPQMLGEVAPELRLLLDATPRVVISILAGMTSERIRGALGDGARVVRVMPNTPARIGQGVSAICLGVGANEGDDSAARALFAGVGTVETIPESLMDAFTVVGGSGPAFVFYLAEAMTRGAIEQGFQEDQAERVVTQTLAGSAALLREAKEDAASLRAAVTSKRGTTEAAMGVLDASGVMPIVQAAIARGTERGRELNEGR